MNLSQACRFGKSSSIALTGSESKTTALFQLARELSPVMIAMKTHLHAQWISEADLHIIMEPTASTVDPPDSNGITVFTASQIGKRFAGLDDASIFKLHQIHQAHAVPLLIEVDNSKGKLTGTPAQGEPAILSIVDTLLVVTGLSDLEKKYIAGLKRIPADIHQIIVLDQADTADSRSKNRALVDRLLSSYHAVVLASLSECSVHARIEPVAGIILAAGESKRFGSPKQLAEYHGIPFVRLVAQAALAAHLSPVVVVTGASADLVEAALNDLPVKIVRNRDWRRGQSSSIQEGLRAATLSPTRHGLAVNTGAAIFLLADQPQVTKNVLDALVEAHSRGISPVILPAVKGIRANPVLFDRILFPDLMALEGDVGGRAVFSKIHVEYLPWHDESLLVDIDKPEDLAKLSI